jgi:hypothetical protein
MRSTAWPRTVYVLCMIAIALLYVVSVPWYRDVDEPLRLWLGLPDWVAVALLCYVGVAILNGIAWSIAEVPDHLGSSTRIHPIKDSGPSDEGEDPQ